MNGIFFEIKKFEKEKSFIIISSSSAEEEKDLDPLDPKEILLDPDPRDPKC